MAKALEYPIVFKALLHGGYICDECSTMGRSVYSVFAKDDNYPTENRKIGHITERQFVALYGILDPHPTAVTRKDKYGNIYHFYVLTPPLTSTKEVQP